MKALLPYCQGGVVFDWEPASIPWVAGNVIKQTSFPLTRPSVTVFWAVEQPDSPFSYEWSRPTPVQSLALKNSLFLRLHSLFPDPDFHQLHLSAFKLWKILTNSCVQQECWLLALSLNLHYVPAWRKTEKIILYTPNDFRWTSLVCFFFHNQMSPDEYTSLFHRKFWTKTKEWGEEEGWRRVACLDDCFVLVLWGYYSMYRKWEYFFCDNPFHCQYTCASSRWLGSHQFNITTILDKALKWFMFQLGIVPENHQTWCGIHWYLANLNRIINNWTWKIHRYL